MLDNLGLFTAPGTASQYPELGNFFLDCGAYSVLTGTWTKLPINEYIEFIIQYQDRIQLLVAPDLIGSASGTFAYLKNFVKVLQSRNKWELVASRVLFTYHLTDRDLVTFSKMARWAYDHGIRWLGIGGIAGTGGSKEGKCAAIEAVTRLVYSDLRLPFKLHLFGGSSVDFVRCFKPDSVDSASYLKKSRVLSLIRFDQALGELCTLNTQGYTNTEQVKLIMSTLNEYDLGVNREVLKKELLKTPPAVRCMMSNLVVISGIESYMRSQVRKSHFKYWVSLASSSFISVSSRHGYSISQVYYKYWTDRCLFSYADLWGEDGAVPMEWLRTFFK